MEYLLTFIEGIVTFISPCLLPLLPVYLSFFISSGSDKKASPWLCAAGFCFGFTAVFSALGLLAGSLGAFLNMHKTAVNLISGGIVVLFGLSYLGILPPLPSLSLKGSQRSEKRGFFPSMLFGAIFSISWTPCVGAFLGSALTQAYAASSAAKGAVLLLCYSLGLSLCFMLCALLMERLRGAFDFIKRNYSIINKISGGLLILTGILMMSGLLSVITRALSR